MSERDGPLLTLGRKLRSLGPPSLTAFIAQLQDYQEYEDFVSIVKELLPERERDILGRAGPQLQIAAFADYFEGRYFPLHDSFKMGEVEGYGDITRGIPVVVLGQSYDDYHEMTDARPGYRLITYLVESPYDEGDGDRVPLAEACASDVLAELLQRVPAGGISPTDLHQLLDGTPHVALARWADVLHLQTNNFFLDTDYEWLWSGGDLPKWTRETVDALTTEWQQAERMEEEVSNLVDWLELDLSAHFSELLDFIEKRLRR